MPEVRGTAARSLETGAPMMIINADDWGRSRAETDAALVCFQAGRLSSASAMVFMEDSERAAEVALSSGIGIGLHLNLSQPFTGKCSDKMLLQCHQRIYTFLRRSRYAFLWYIPALRKDFRYTYEAQAAEFLRLYGKPPERVDGHQHMHLCSNMLIDRVIPHGLKVRRNFSFQRGEKGFFNRTYRRLADAWLARFYRLTDYFFALYQCFDPEIMTRARKLAAEASVEIMAHPAKTDEFDFIMSREFNREGKELR